MTFLDGPTWIAITELADIASLCISLPINFLLLFCICTKSPKEFGGYKKLMMWFSIQGVFFSILASFTHMCFHTIDGTFMMFTIYNPLNLSQYIIWTMLGMCCVSVGYVLCTLSAQFVYRYFAMSKPNNLKYFHGWRRLYFFLIMILVAVVYGGCGFVGINLTPERDTQIRESMGVDYNVTPDNVHYVAVEYYVRDASNGRVINWTSIGTAAMLNSVFGTMVFVIVYCGVKTYKGTQVKTSNLSNHLKIQKQLFTALLVQTATPTVLIFIPCIIFYVLPIFAIPLGTDANILSVSLVLYPIVDPIGVMYIIKPYRNYLQKFCIRRTRCNNNMKIHSVSQHIPRLSSEVRDSPRFHGIVS